MSHALDLSIVVGEHETHRVDFHWSQGFGSIRILVDGEVALRKRELFSWSTTTQYAVHVGKAERHSVVFERTRPRVLAGLRQQTVQAMVDGRLVGEA